jgi:hypothetical protein
VLAHRVILHPDHEIGERPAERLIAEVMASVAPPVR